jgi:uncharacterized membrane protein YfcA
MHVYVSLVLIGLVTGVLTGLLGLGGGVLMIPLLLQISIPLQQAVGIVLAIQVIPQSIFGALEYYKSGNLDIKNSLIVALGSGVGIYFGALLMTRKAIPEWFLYRMLGFVMIGLGGYILAKFW